MRIVKDGTHRAAPRLIVRLTERPGQQEGPGELAVRSPVNGAKHTRVYLMLLKLGHKSSWRLELQRDEPCLQQMSYTIRLHGPNVHLEAGQ